MSKMYEATSGNIKLAQKKIAQTCLYSQWKKECQNKITKLDSRLINVLQGIKILAFEIVISAGQKLFASLPGKNNLQT